MALLVAAITALALVPAGAWATAVSGTGRFPAATGTLTVNSAAQGEEYKAYQLLVLASFNDGDVAVDKHATDAYSYVINSGSPWLEFFTVSGKAGNDYFDVDQSNPVTIGTGQGNTYYIVTPKETFRNAFSDTAAQLKDETSADEWTSTSLVQKFAQDALAYANDNKTGANAVTVTAYGTGAGANLTLTTDGSNTALPLGYYLIDSTQGTLCSLDTLNPNVAVEDKNELPTLDKAVQEDSRIQTGQALDDKVNAYQKVDDAEIGEAVYFKSTVTVQDGAKGYVLRDYMDPGLTWDESYGTNGVEVYFVPNGADATPASWVELSGATTPRVEIAPNSYKGSTALTSADYYTLTKTGTYEEAAGSSPAVMDTFEITFDDGFLNFLSDNMKGSAAPQSFDIVVAYKATVNAKAKVGATEGNKNKTYLEYGEKTAKSKTPEAVTTTYTWPITVRKYTSRNSQETGLAGAVFELYNYDNIEGGSTPAGGKRYAFVKLNAGDEGFDSTISYPQYKVIGEQATSGYDEQTGYFAADGNTGTQASHAYQTKYYNLPIAALGDTGAATHEYYTQLTTPAGGKFVVSGLDEGAYYLKEVQAPNGYNLLPNCVRVTLDSTTDTVAATDATAALSSVTYVSKKTGDAGSRTYSNEQTDNTTLNGGSSDASPISILNNTGTELPSTGGIGTTVFYVVGGILVAGSVVLLITKRRMASES